MTVEYVRALLEEGHYVMVVTNATVDKSFEAIAGFPKELLRRLFFKFSYHYMQLKERGLLERFFRNVKMMRDAGASFTLEVTPYDELVPYVDELVALAEKEVGAAPHFTIARDENYMGDMPKLTKMNDAEYRATWGRFNSRLFDFKMDIFQRPRREFCYAGDWVCYISLETGMMFTCHEPLRAGVDVFSDVTKPIPFKPVGNNCKAPHCWNGHSWIALGAIPEMDAPTYAELRNRKCADGSEWLKPDMKSFMSTKLWESNRECSAIGKLRVNMGFGKHWYTHLGRNLKLALGKRP